MAFADATRDVDGRPVGATVSIGIVISHDAVLDLSALLAQADHALYRAKDSGRNRVEIASIELILDRARRGAPTSASRRSARPPQDPRPDFGATEVAHASGVKRLAAGHGGIAPAVFANARDRSGFIFIADLLGLGNPLPPGDPIMLDLPSDTAPRRSTPRGSTG